jgi:hypothetical protein
LNLSKNTVYLETMKRVGKIAIWLAGGLLLSAGARADDAVVASDDNPYAPIVTRNVFGLNPVQADEPVGDPPPKITPNGIMSISGRLQVLFKVAGTGSAGQPAKDQFYILSESQRQDDIEVTHIDDKASLITFDNHGTVQKIPLANAPAATTPAPGRGPVGQVSQPGFGRPMGGRAGGAGVTEIGSSSRRGGADRQNHGRRNDANQNQNNGANTGGGMTVESLQSIPTRPGDIGQQQPQNTMSPEERAAAMLLNTAKLKSEGNPAWKIMPQMPGVPPLDE